ncbi:MAG: TRAP transporter small permease [Acetobacteraceae bacterium]|nr:TRAP transporter small permease [Acetobacteraceae bacterium]
MRHLADRADRLLLSLNRFVCATLLGAMATLVFANVIGRYVFGVSASWAEEVARYLMIWSALLAAGLALREGAHIAVETLPDNLPPRAAIALRALVVAMVGAFLGVLVWLGLEYAEFARLQRTPVLRLSMGFIYLAIPIGAGLCLLHLLIVLPRLVRPQTDEEKVHAAELGSAL